VSHKTGVIQDTYGVSEKTVLFRRRVSVSHIILITPTSFLFIPALTGVLCHLCRGLEGEKEIETQWITSHGSSARDGVEREKVKAKYYYRPVSNMRCIFFTIHLFYIGDIYT
jgi:hypothetical protein